MPSDVTKAAVPGSAHEDPAEEPRSRRNVLRALGAAAAGAVAGGLLPSGQALAHGGFHQDFNGPDPAIHGNNSGDGPGVEGTGVITGVHGQGAIGLHGQGQFGVQAEGSNMGVRGEGPTGVYGSGSNVGVWGSSPTNVGVQAVSEDGTGLFAQGIFGTAILAISGSTGFALDVRGRAKFSTVGSGVIPIGQDSVLVSTRPGEVSPNSHITVTLTGSPGPVVSGPPAVVHWVERQPDLAFVIHLTRRVGQATPFTYLIVEPGQQSDQGYVVWPSIRGEKSVNFAP